VSRTSGRARAADDGWRRRAGRVATRLERRVDRVVFEAKRRTGLLGPLEIHAYRGHGTPRLLLLRARVLERPGVIRASARDSARRNLRNMARRFLTYEVPGARVVASFAGIQRELVADEEGYVEARLDLPVPLADRPAWHEIELELTWPPTPKQPPVRATGRVLVPGNASYAVVSDMDDTVIQSGVTRLLTMLRVALLSNAHTRLPFQGVAAFYRALQRGPDGRGWNPIFYVSGSPWNLADVIEDFMDVHGVPRGPLFLRDWSPFTVRGGTRRHKLEVIDGLLELYPDLPFVLIGDSGEHDPEIYREVVLAHPGRVRAVYIREVTGPERRAQVDAIAAELREHGVDLVHDDDTEAAALHARANGLIAAGADAEAAASP
jgi:phosphatidate phosphatase APP1